MEGLAGVFIGLCLCFLIVLIEELIRTKKWNETIWTYFVGFGLAVNFCSIMQIVLIIIENSD